MILKGRGRGRGRRITSGTLVLHALYGRLGITTNKVDLTVRRHLGDDGNVELGIVLLHVVGAVLGAEFLDHGRDMFGVSDRSCLDFSFCAARIDANGRVLEDVFVPLGV